MIRRLTPDEALERAHNAYRKATYSPVPRIDVLREIRNARREAEKAEREQAVIERERQRQSQIEARNAELLAVIAIEEKVALNELRQMVKDIERQQLDKRIERIEAKASDTVATHQEPLISLAFDTAYVYEPRVGKLVEKRRTA